MMVILLVAFLVWVASRWWRMYFDFLHVPWSFSLPFEAVQWMFLTKKNEKEPYSSFIFRKIVGKCKKYEKQGVFLVGMASPKLFIFSEEYVKMLSNDPALIDKPWFYEVFFSGMEKYGNIIVSSGEKWRRDRRLIHPAFKFSILKENVPFMNRHAAGLVQDLGQFGGETTDETLGRVKFHTMRLFLESSVGLDLEAEGNEDRVKRIVASSDGYLEAVCSRVYKPWLHVEFLWRRSSEHAKLRRCSEDLMHLVEDVFRQVKDRFLSQNLTAIASGEDEELESRKFKSFGDVLMAQHLKDPSFTETEILGQLLLTIGAGFDTGANTLTWVFWLLGLHPDKQEKAYEEVVSETGPYITVEDTRKLSYVECVIKETMRLYPVVPIYARTASQDIHCGKLKIPKKTPVIFVPYALHRNPEVYPDPEAFNPDRFLDWDSSNSPWNFVPFAEGSRSCVGKNYAMLVMKIIVAHVLRNFRIVSLDRREDVFEAWEVVLTSATPLRMKFVPRQPGIQPALQDP